MEQAEVFFASISTEPTISLTFSLEITPTATSTAALPNWLHCWEENKS